MSIATSRTTTSAADFLPQRRTLAAARRAAAGCRGCPLWQNATQTVFGVGAAHARVMLVGEQPGDKEDLAGLPFVGPAGRLLDRALGAAGIDRDDTYVTNVVKHFKWEPRGSRRLHRSPNTREVGACLPWLEMEIDLVKPEALVCLGATAGRALLGRDFLVTRDRGKRFSSQLGPTIIGTVHPSSLLRLRDEHERDAAMQQLVTDLELVREVLK
jgi:uracil-DNA glycosylase family protein